MLLSLQTVHKVQRIAANPNPNAVIIMGNNAKGGLAILELEGLRFSRQLKQIYDFNLLNLNLLKLSSAELRFELQRTYVQVVHMEQNNNLTIKN